jgi:hypothetical protein
MRPIFITSLTLMAGAFAILQDPIFNGMAISLLFGAGVATVMALLIIPLGCISARKQFYVETSDEGQVRVSPAFEMVEHVSLDESTGESDKSLLARLWGGIFALFSWVFMIIKAIFTMIGMGFKSLFGRSGGGTPPPPRPGGGTPPPPRQTPPGGGTPPPPREAPPGKKAKGTPPPPREVVPAKAKETPPSREVVPAKAKGTPPPPREVVPAKAKDTPPPPREMPPSKVKGTPPPPREMPPSKAKDTAVAPSPRETAPPKLADKPPAPAAKEPAVAGKPKSEAAEKKVSDVEDNGVVGKKRRGIRLKQNLD